MNEYELQQSREYQAAKDLENALNNMSWRRSVRTYHRTLQQELFRTIVAVIREMAASDYGTDLRNQASHDTAKAIVESGVLDDAYLPFV